MLATSRFNSPRSSRNAARLGSIFVEAHDVEFPVRRENFCRRDAGETMAEALRLGKIRKILMPVFRLRQTSLVGPRGIDWFPAFVRSWDAVGAWPE